MIFKSPMVMKYESSLRENHSRSESGIVVMIWSVSEAVSQTPERALSWSRTMTQRVYHSEENDVLEAGPEAGEGSGPLLCPLDYIL